MTEQLILTKGDKGFELAVPGKENWILLRQEGYSPVQSLVAAVGACGGYVLESILTNSKIPYQFDKIDVTYVLNENAPVKTIKSIDLVFYLAVQADYQERTKRALKSVSRYCPVIQSLDKSIAVTENIVFI